MTIPALVHLVRLVAPTRRPPLPVLPVARTTLALWQATPFSELVHDPLPRMPRQQFSTRPAGAAQAYLWGHLKRCRSRRELEALEEKLVFKTAKQWNLRIEAHARVGHPDRSLEMLRELRDAGVSPNNYVHNQLVYVIAFSTVISDEARDGKWTKVLSELKKMRGLGIEPNVVVYDAAISACEKLGRWNKALSLLEEMRDAGILPSASTYTAAISACKKGKRWKKVLSLFEEMRGTAIEPDAAIYGAAISASEKGGEWERALSLLEEMRRVGMEPDATTYGAAISACEKGGNWDKALSLLREMRRAGKQPNATTYNAAISAFGKDGQWEEALSLITEMRGQGIAPDVMTYNAAISACEKDKQWKKALSLFDEMRCVGVEPDVMTYNISIQACASAEQSVEAIQIFSEAQQNVEINAITYNAILDAVCFSHPAKARELYSCGLGLYGAVERTKNGNPMLDLHQHSEGAGETAVRWWLEERLPAMANEPKQLIIATGPGKSQSAIHSGNLRGRVETVLANLRLPTRPVDKQGRLVVDLMAWQWRQAQPDRLSLPLPQSSPPD